MCMLLSSPDYGRKQISSSGYEQRACVFFIYFGGIRSPIHDYPSIPDQPTPLCSQWMFLTNYVKNGTLNIVNNVSLKESSALVYEVGCKSYIHCAFTLANQAKFTAAVPFRHIFRDTCVDSILASLYLSKYFVQRVLLYIKFRLPIPLKYAEKKRTHTIPLS